MSNLIPFNRRDARGHEDDTLDCIALELSQAGQLHTLPSRIYEEMCLMLEIEEQPLGEMTEDTFAHCKKMIDDVLDRQFRNGVISKKLELTR